MPDPVPLAPTTEALRAHPEFRQAMRRSIRGLIDLYQGNRLLNRVMNDRGRTMMGFFALYLDALGRAEPGRPGLTAAGVRALFARTGLYSPGRVAAMLALMQFGGYVAPAPAAADRRLKRLRSTPRLIEVHMARWRVQFRAIGLLRPDATEICHHLDDPGFRDAFVIALVEERLAGPQVIDAAPGLELFVERDAGMIVLFSLLAEAAERPGAAIPVSLSALSRRFGVSRVHVSHLLRDAAAASLLDRRTDGSLRLSPVLEDAAETFFAEGYRRLLGAARAAGTGAAPGVQAA